MSTVHIHAAPTPTPEIIAFNPNARRHFIGGSDARIIMVDHQDRLFRLWLEKRGEVEPKDLSGNLIVQLGNATEALNRTFYQRSTGQIITDVQKRVRHPVHKWMAATLDGMVEQQAPCSRPSSCCPGPSPKKLRPKSIWLSCSRTRGLSRRALRCFQSLPVAANGSRSRFMLIRATAPPAHGRAEVLALRPERRATHPVQHRNAAPETGSCQGRRHGLIQHVGRVCRGLSEHKGCPRRA